jgi:localization factor PodJL
VSLASGVGVTSPRRQNGAALREPEPRRERREPDFRTLASAAGQEGRPSAASLQTDFIAAARRAAQQAALDAEAAARAQQNSRRAGVRGDDAGEEAGEGASGAMSSVGSALLARKRPLLLGIGALVLLVGAYQVARISIQGVEPFAGNPSQERQAGEPAAPEAEAPAAKEPAAKEPAPPASQGSAPPPRMISPPRVETAPPQKPAERAAAIAPLVDPTPIGGIPAGVSPPSAPDAIALVRSQALQGQAAAQYEMGVRYADGRGVGRDGAVAAQWLEKAASQGLAPAQYRLGSLYEKGVGVERDLGRARQLYQTAATAGNARAMHNLAVLLAEGGDGGKPDYASASEWFRRAAEYGVRDSQYNLAILYARGLGVDQNLTQSYLWFSAAADQGDADAARKRDEVGARLDSKELAAAKALAAGFHAKEPLREANDVLPPTGGWGGAKDPAGAGRPAQKPSAKAKFSAI